MAKQSQRQESSLQTPPRAGSGKVTSASPASAPQPPEPKAVVPAWAEPTGSTTPAPSVLSEHEIAIRAFEIWQAEGSLHGRDLDHWFAAERELRPKGRS
jgi:hypothetical protein